MSATASKSENGALIAAGVIAAALYLLTRDQDGGTFFRGGGSTGDSGPDPYEGLDEEYAPVTPFRAPTTQQSPTYANQPYAGPAFVTQSDVDRGVVLDWRIPTGGIMAQPTGATRAYDISSATGGSGLAPGRPTSPQGVSARLYDLQTADERQGITSGPTRETITHAVGVQAAPLALTPAAHSQSQGMSIPSTSPLFANPNFAKIAPTIAAQRTNVVPTAPAPTPSVLQPKSADYLTRKRITDL